MTLDKAYLEYRTRRLERALKSNDAHLLKLGSYQVSLTCGEIVKS